MSKRMKIIVSVVAAVVLLAVGGTMMVMADDGPATEPPAGVNTFLERLAEKLGVDVQTLKDTMIQTRPERLAFGNWAGGPGPRDLFGSLPEDIDREALREAIAQALEEARGQENFDPREVIAGVMESFGIDVDALEAAREEAWAEMQAKRTEAQEQHLAALAEALGKDVQEVKDAFEALREEIQAERPFGDCLGARTSGGQFEHPMERPFGHPFARHSGRPFGPRFGGGFGSPQGS